jgi:nucleoside-diphosphate-sugar epimerase
MFSIKYQMRSVSILGGGWLGLPLAILLRNKNWKVKVSTTSIHKIEDFNSFNLVPYLLTVEKEGYLDSDFLDSEVIVICFPPKFKSENPEDYLLKIRHLALSISGVDKIKKVVFVSSTSVYEDSDGMKSEPDADINHPLYKAERLLTEKLIHQKVIITRMAGLMGYDRNPCKYFGIREFVVESAVNYIHRDDATEILAWLVEHFEESITLNLSAPNHPTRGQIAEIVCKKQQPNPKLKTKKGKIINTDLLQQIYPKKFLFPDPLKFKYL